MNKEVLDRVEFLLAEYDRSLNCSKYQRDCLLQLSRETRGGFPHVPISQKKDKYLLDIKVLQKDLNRQKNLLSKISKLLRENS